MIFLLSLLATAAPATSEPKPYELGAPATAQGAQQTVSQLLEATFAKDNVGFERIARGIVVMLAPDFGVPVSREQFEVSLKDCSVPRVISSVPFPKLPKAQAVRISMQCITKEHPEPIDTVADIMADNEHAFVIFPGGVERVWPAKPRR